MIVFLVPVPGRSEARPSRGVGRWLRAGLATILLLHGCAPGTTQPDGGSLPSPQEASRAVAPLRTGTPTYAPGRVIIRLVPGESIEELRSSHGALLLASEPLLDLHLLGLASGTSEPSFAQMLRNDSRVLFAEVDFALRTPESSQSSMAFDEGHRSWSEVADQGALQRIGVHEAHLRARGRGVLIAVLDTGVELDHPALAGRLELPGFEPGPAPEPGDDRAEGVDTDGDGVIDGSHGHGTHVAGIALTVAPDARILPVRVLDSDGVGYAFEVARGIVHAVERGSRVLNLSLGMPNPSLAVAAALSHAGAAGCVVVGAAGNRDEFTVDFPAAHADVVATAATDSADRKAPFSNYHADVDLSAPGVGILSAYVDGRTARWSGTSMAAPFVAGVAALLYEAEGGRSVPGATRIKLRLREGTDSVAETDPIHAAGLGAGRVSAIGSLGSLPGTAGPTEGPDPMVRGLR